MVGVRLDHPPRTTPVAQERPEVDGVRAFSHGRKPLMFGIFLELLLLRRPQLVQGSNEQREESLQFGLPHLNLVPWSPAPRPAASSARRAAFNGALGAASLVGFASQRDEVEAPQI